MNMIMKEEEKEGFIKGRRKEKDVHGGGYEERDGNEEPQTVHGEPEHPRGEPEAETENSSSPSRKRGFASSASQQVLVSPIQHSEGNKIKPLHATN